MKYKETKGMISELRQDKDEAMNWVREDAFWGDTKAAAGISVSVSRTVTLEGILHESYCFTNNKIKDYFSKEGELAICVPFPDYYPSTEKCLTDCCHVHLWCNGQASWIKAHRMSGTGESMGLILSKGSISGYEVVRSGESGSNDRGKFWLNLSPVHLLPGESYCITWDVFAFTGNEEFEKMASKYPHISLCHPKHMIWFENELDEEKKGHLILPKFRKLLKARCQFIADKQQYHNPESALDGAFLIYDNEEKSMYYSDNHDHNGGRERIAMGVLLALYLQRADDPTIDNALKQYTAYIHRELFDRNTGVVYNDIGRDNTWNRLYNYPWMAVFFMERYNIYKEKEDLMNMFMALKSYYTQGGENFYAIAIPMKESLDLLESAKMTAERNELLSWYIRHGDVIAKRGVHYPAFEVNFEQSIVAPAVYYMFELFRITGMEKYRIAGEQQLDVLSAFSGDQPDYHLFEVGIRHWDGYWFGKKKMFGDTFPHYWSALSGLAFQSAALAGETGYELKAENALRGVLSMFHEDGSATCAYVYPDRVNGINAKFEDPWANDQDWGMYFYAKYGMNSY